MLLHSHNPTTTGGDVFQEQVVFIFHSLPHTCKDLLGIPSVHITKYMQCKPPCCAAASSSEVKPRDAGLAATVVLTPWSPELVVDMSRIRMCCSGSKYPAASAIFWCCRSSSWVMEGGDAYCGGQLPACIVIAPVRAAVWC